MGDHNRANIMKNILILATIIFISAYSASGISIVLDKTISYKTTSICSIKLLLSKPDRPYKEFALIEGSAATDDYFTKAKKTSRSRFTKKGSC